MNFRQVAAGFTLQHHCRDEELDVDQGNAVRQVEQGVAHRQAEFLLLVELAELSGNRFGDFIGNHFEGGCKGMSGADGACQRIDSLGKLFLKFLETLLAHVRGVGIGNEKPEHQADPAEEQAAPAMSRIRASSSAEATQSMRKLPARTSDFLGQHFLQKGDALRAPQERVEGRYPAEQFVAQQSCIRHGLVGRLLNRERRSRRTRACALR